MQEIFSRTSREQLEGKREQLLANKAQVKRRASAISQLRNALISLFLQQVRHYSPSLTGLALLPAFGFALLATSFSGRLMARIGAKNVMVTGLLLSALSCFGFVLVDSQTSYLLLACLLAVLGGGLALVLPS